MTGPGGGSGDVPGDPATAGTVAARLAGVADALATAARGLPIEVPDGWRGPAAAAFLRLIGSQTSRIETAAAACQRASSALAGYAQALAAAQGTAAQASLLRAADPHRAGVVTARARQSARAAAARAAAAIEDAARGAPRRPGVLARLWRTGEDWRAEIGLGADESLEGLVGLALRLAPTRALGDPAGFAADARRITAGLLHDVTHPPDLVAGLLDRDTWTSNPARAVGHLVPDAVAAAVSGGSATAARRSLAAMAHTARQQALRDTAASARARFVERTRPGVRAAEREEWIGPSGLRLSPDAHAAVAAYWRAVRAAEPAMTRRIQALADDVGGRLAGIEHRVKSLDSLRRKLADRLGGPGSGSGTDLAGGRLVDRWPSARRVWEVLGEQGDTLRYTLVIDDERYASAVSQAAAHLDRAQTSLTSFRNTWQGTRYRGINGTWTDPVTGLRFEIQFHTPSTWRATVRTHPWYEIYRLPDTPSAVREDLGARIAAVYAQAPLPRRSVRLTPSTMPPLPDPPAAALDAAAGAAAAMQAGTTAAAPRLTPPPSQPPTRRGRR